jgi:hypothetical protein
MAKLIRCDRPKNVNDAERAGLRAMLHGHIFQSYWLDDVYYEYDETADEWWTLDEDLLDADRPEQDCHN